MVHYKKIDFYSIKKENDYSWLNFKCVNKCSEMTKLRPAVIMKVEKQIHSPLQNKTTSSCYSWSPFSKKVVDYMLSRWYFESNIFNPTIMEAYENIWACVYNFYLCVIWRKSTLSSNLLCVFNFYQYGRKDAGDIDHVPPGWDQWNALVSARCWFLLKRIIPFISLLVCYVQVGNSQYYNYTLSVNGKPEPHGDNYEKDYLTDLIVSHNHTPHRDFCSHSVLWLAAFHVITHLNGCLCKNRWQAVRISYLHKNV